MLVGYKKDDSGGILILNNLMKNSVELIRRTKNNRKLRNENIEKVGKQFSNFFPGSIVGLELMKQEEGIDSSTATNYIDRLESLTTYDF